MRLNIAAGTAVRFEPGEEKEMELTEFGGMRVIHGGNGLVRGAAREARSAGAGGRKREEAGFLFNGEGERALSLKIPRRTYADLYGPTTGDRIRLADTELIIEIEKDFAHYGDEITFGGGKVIRDGMGQSAALRREGRMGALDLVITNAVISIIGAS